MVEPFRPARGGFLCPFGSGWFIREFLLGNGSMDSLKIDPDVGATQIDIHRYRRPLPDLCRGCGTLLEEKGAH